MNRKALVHMLPTKQLTMLSKHKEDGRLGLKSWVTNQGERLSEYQYLYFTTDEEIKVGDWYIGGNKLGKADGKYGTLLTDRKVVATTNPDLWNTRLIDSNKFEGLSHFPLSLEECLMGKIETDFIEAYVRAEGKITEVMLEYEQGNWYAEKDLGYRCLDCNYVSKEKKCKCTYKLKLRNNGTVIIKPVSKDDRFLEEIDDLIRIARANTSATLPGLLVAREKILSWKNKNN